MPHQIEVCSMNLTKHVEPKNQRGVASCSHHRQHLIDARWLLGNNHIAKFDTFLYFSAKTWQYISCASAELGFLSISKEEFQPLVTWQKKWDTMRLANTKAAIYIALMKSFQAGISISRTVVELTTSFDALNTGFGSFLYSDQHTSLPSSSP